MRIGCARSPRGEFHVQGALVPSPEEKLRILQQLLWPLVKETLESVPNVSESIRTLMPTTHVLEFTLQVSAIFQFFNPETIAECHSHAHGAQFLSKLSFNATFSHRHPSRNRPKVKCVAIQFSDNDLE